MNSHTTYLVFGPTATRKRMASKLFSEEPPTFLYTRVLDEIQNEIHVAVYEEYEKQINSSVTLTCIFENTPKFNKIVLKKTGGRIGFRGSSLMDERSIDSNVIDFIFDFAKRHGLTVQEELMSDQNEED